MEMLNRTGVALTISLSLLLLPLAGSAGAVSVEGVYNPYDLVDGNIYIPLSENSSGVLGEELPDGSFVGLGADKVKLTTQYPTSSGYVDLMVDFDISGELAPGEFIAYDSDMSMWINFDDLDFKTHETTVRKWNEWLEIVLYDDLGELVVGADVLVLDESTYMTYRQDFVGDEKVTETNNVYATYGEISIHDVFFGSDTASWNRFVDSLNETSEFKMLLTFHTEIELTRRKSLMLTNAIEQLDSSQILIENIAPEPGTLSMLALGGLAMLARRKKRE